MKSLRKENVLNVPPKAGSPNPTNEEGERGEKRPGNPNPTNSSGVLLQGTQDIRHQDVKISYADKVKQDVDLQVAVYVEPSREFTDDDKGEFLDVMGNFLCEIPDDQEMPEFKQTIKRDNLLVVTAVNQYSCAWLLKTIPCMESLNGYKLLCSPMKELKYKKGLL